MTLQSKNVTDKSQRGYALLMVIFMVATVLILATAGSLSIITQGQRERETELAWRGNQYVRAIHFYYMKNGRYPKSIDDLTAYHTDQPRYLRQAYKDPMNAGDGSWHLIYVLPNGQLSGSIMHKQLQGAMPIAGPLGGTPVGGISPGGSGGAAGQPTGTGTGTGTQQPPATGQTGTTGQSDSQTSDSPVFGGSIIGVSSKINKPSLRVYKLGTSYNQWEFIWDPTSTTGTAGPTPGSTPTGTQTPPPPGQPQGPGQSQNPGQPQNPQIDH